MRVPEPRDVQYTKASYYGHFHDGMRTADGETFDPHALTAAHPTLPFFSIVEITNPLNNKRICVRINDRGPYVYGRGIDLSERAAGAIDLDGVGEVELRVLRWGREWKNGEQERAEVVTRCRSALP